MDYVFIITYGRSGSTLLQGILNRHDGFHITGENGNLLASLYDMHLRLLEAKKISGKNLRRKQTDPYFGIDFIKSDLSFGLARSLLEQITLPSWNGNARPHTIGYKEIRFPFLDDPQGFLAWLRECFPKGAFIFNTRSLDAVLQSGFHKKLGGEEREAQRKRFLAFEKVCENFCFRDELSVMISYDEYAAHPEVLIEQMAKCGLTLDASRILEATKTMHSYTWANKKE